MDVILLQRVPKLGQMGDVVKVRPGFARNFLLPQGKAARATEENRKRFEAEKAQLEALNLERKAEAADLAGRLANFSVVLIRQAGESGQLYGSVNARDVATAIIAGGVTVSRQQVELSQPIKTLGLHTVRLVLHPEVVVGITVNVARSAEQAELQAERGRAYTAADAEADVEAEAAEATALFSPGEEPAPGGGEQPELDHDAIAAAEAARSGERT